MSNVFITILITFIITFIILRIAIFFIYNKPNIEINVTKGDDYDTYRIYFNYIHYIEYLEYSEKENRSKHLFTFRKKHKNDERRT